MTRSPSLRSVLSALSGLPAVCFMAAALSSAAWVSAPAGAAAQQSDDELARHFFETGRTYFARAQYAEAAEAFGEAYRLSGRAALLVNQGRALESAGDIPGAIAALEQAQEELDPNTELYPTIAPRLERLRAQEGQEAEIAAAAAARASEEERAREEARAQEEREQADQAMMAADNDSAEGPGVLFWVGVGAAGLGAAALITSVATGIAAHGVYGDLEAACPGDVCPPGYQGDIDRGTTLSVASTAMLFVGALAGAAGLTLIVISSRGHGEGDDESATAALRVGPGSVFVDGTF